MLKPSFLFALASLGACSSPAEQQATAPAVAVTPVQPNQATTPSPQPTVQTPSTSRYRCMDGSKLVASLDPARGRATVSRGGKVLTLRAEPSASGIRYNARGYELRTNAPNLTFTAPGKPPIACTVIR